MNNLDDIRELADDHPPLLTAKTALRLINNLFVGFAASAISAALIFNFGIVMPLCIIEYFKITEKFNTFAVITGALLSAFAGAITAATTIINKFEFPPEHILNHEHDVIAEPNLEVARHRGHLHIINHTIADYKNWQGYISSPIKKMEGVMMARYD